MVHYLNTPFIRRLPRPRITQFHSANDLSMALESLWRPRPAQRSDSGPSTWMRSDDNGIPDGTESSSSPVNCDGPTWAGQDVWLGEEGKRKKISTRIIKYTI